MVCRLLAAGLIALAFAAPAAAQPRSLWPGVSYTTGVQFTPHGPVAISVLTGPRPGGMTTLAPVLSNDALTGTETLTGMERRIAPSATAAGVNGDFFTLRTGVPSGIYMRDGQVASPPSGSRSSAGVLTDGTLDIRRVSFFGTWQGAGLKHAPVDAQRAATGERERALHAGLGPATLRARVGCRDPVPVSGCRSQRGAAGSRRRGPQRAALPCRFRPAAPS